MPAKNQIDLIIKHLGQYVTEHKRAVIENVLSRRTRYLTIVLEDIYQSQNASAVFRTAECYGIQDIHLIENQIKYSLNKRVLKGANKWLNIIHHDEKSFNNTERCFYFLRKEGYQILATSPEAKLHIDEVDVSKKIALVMGNELHGLSDFARTNADKEVQIPMHGFTESLNLSVSAAVCVHELIPKIRGSQVRWTLTTEEKEQLRLSWYRKLVRNSDLIEKEFLKTN